MLAAIKTKTPLHWKLWNALKERIAARRKRLQRIAWINELDNLFAQQVYIKHRSAELTRRIAQMDRTDQ